MSAMEVTPLVQTATETAQATKGFDWSTVIPTTIGAVIALAGVGISQFINLKLKRAELEQQRREAKLKRVQDSAKEYLSVLSQVNSLHSEIIYKLERYQLTAITLKDGTNKINGGNPKDIQSALNLIRKGSKEIEDLLSKEDIVKDLNRLEKLILVDLSACVVLFQRSDKSIEFVENSERLINKAKKHCEILEYLFPVFTKAIRVTESLKLDLSSYPIMEIETIANNMDNLQINMVRLSKLMSEYLKQTNFEITKCLMFPDEIPN